MAARANSTQLYTVQEAANRLSVHKMTMYRLIWDGAIPYVNLAKPGQRARLRIREAALDAYLAPRESAGRAA